MSPIRIAIAGVGNCASSLVQGLNYYRLPQSDDVPGLMHPILGGYRIGEIVPVAAFDVDQRKVGKDLSDAILAPPNCTYRFSEVPRLGVTVLMGPVMDGVPPHLSKYVEVGPDRPVDVPQILSDAKADVLINFLPTGSAKASRFYAECAFESGTAFINGIPELIASDPQYALTAEKRKVPIVGDDFKSQIGATILHRALVSLCAARGVKIKKSYQLNFAGNTDFCNLVRRGESKEITKLNAVESLIPYDADIAAGFAFIKNMDDTKTAVIMIEGEKFGGAPVRIDVKLTVEDSPNSAGVLIDAIRCCKLALDRGTGGVLISASACFMKHPPEQYPDEEARRMLEEFLAGERER